LNFLSQYFLTLIFFFGKFNFFCIFCRVKNIHVFKFLVLKILVLKMWSLFLSAYTYCNTCWRMFCCPCIRRKNPSVYPLPWKYGSVKMPVSFIIISRSNISPHNCTPLTLQLQTNVTSFSAKKVHKIFFLQKKIAVA